MKPARCLLALALCGPVSASVLFYSDQVNDVFASVSYSLTADNKKNITANTFSDGSSTTSGLETTDKPNMFEPNSGFIFLAPGDQVLSAQYDLSYAFNVTSPRNVTDTGDGTNSKAQTDPNFTAQADNLKVTLAFKDINGNTLERVDVTNLSSPLDLLPYLLGLAGPDSLLVANAFDTTGIFLKTRIRADDVVFSADLSTYNPSTTTNPDKNVIIDYTVKDKLSATSSVTLDVVPEPSTFALLALGLAAAAARKLVKR